jgi:MFS family permease
MLPLSLGLLIVGPVSGYLSDRYGARGFATAGLVLSAIGFSLLMLLPIDFAYPALGAVIFLIGAAMGLFVSPNRAAVMNALPSESRGVGGAMNQTFQNSAQVLSIGIFFTLLIFSLAGSLPGVMSTGLQALGISPAVAQDAAGTPPVSILFAAFLGYDPVEHLVGPAALAHVSPHDHAVLTSSTFFPQLISRPFQDGLDAAFLFALVACLLAALASLMRGGQPLATVPAAAATPPSGS